MGDLALFEEGPLDKKGSLKHWKKKYCTLQNSKFSYRPFKGSESSFKSVEMSTVHSVRAVRGKPGSSNNEIHMHLKCGKEMIFGAYSVEDQDRWVKVLQKAIEFRWKRESLRASILEYEREREMTLYDQPWDLEAVVNNTNEKFKESTRRAKPLNSVDPILEHAKTTDSLEVQQQIPPRITPYAEVVLFPKPSKPTDSVSTTVSPYAETFIINPPELPQSNGRDGGTTDSVSTTVSPYAETYIINPPELPQSNGRDAGTIYSKCSEVKPEISLSPNDASGYSYAQIYRRKISKDTAKDNVEKFVVSYSAFDSDAPSGDSSDEESESPQSCGASPENGGDSETGLATLKEALGVFAVLKKYSAPVSLKYPNCQKSPSFIQLKEYISSSNANRLTKPRSFKMGSYVTQLKRSVTPISESAPKVQIAMEMSL